MNWQQVRASLAGPTPHPLADALFLRLLGLIYIAAFGSLLPQITGLIGSHGVVSAVHLMQAVRSEMGTAAYRQVPSLFWFFLSDNALVAFCIIGCIAGCLIVLGVFSRLAATVCFVLYLSIVTVGAPFLNFQWDALLLEAGFLAMFSGAGWLVWGYRLLLLRLMFESGFVKLASHDPNWRNFHALRFHFMTQPLPNPLAYYADRIPGSVLDGMAAITLFIEFAAPVMLWFPRRIRYTGAALIVLLQIAILLTGNYAFFNWLTIALCVWALDDEFLVHWTRLLQWRPVQLRGLSVGTTYLRAFGNVCVACLIGLGVIQFLNAVGAGSITPGTSALADIGSFEIVNSYGLFAVMTSTRPEIVLEGSDDQVTWREYSFPYKPGNTHRTLPWVAPYQPRLDWQMWFAALDSYPSNTWVGGLMYGVMTGQSQVLGLLNPAPFQKPPRYMRALLYLYDFTTPDERRRTGAVWIRTLQGTWVGPVSLRQTS
jgi:hypothetical protein